MPPSVSEAVELAPGDSGVACLWLGGAGAPPLTLSDSLLAALDERLTEVEAGVAEGRVRAVIVRARTPGSFVGASDLQPLRGLSRAEDATGYALNAQRVLRRLEELAVPTIAVLDGACVGGGLELALACAYRIASDSPRTRLGLPEVRTGLIPGFGGTVRLPRLVGIQAALEMIVGGRLVDTGEALRIGLVDAVVPARTLEEEVGRFARDRAEKRKLRTGARRRVRRRVMEDTAPGRRLLFLRAARRLIPRTAPAAAAPRRALEAIAGGVALPLDRAFQREATIFGQLAVTPDAQALIHTQLLLHSTTHPTPASAPLERAAVLGAGEVGSALAYLLARGRIPVRLKDRQRAAMAAGVEAARASLAGRADISPATGFGGFGTLDFVAIAVGDRDQSVRLALREAEEHTSDGCVFILTSPLLAVSAAQQAVAAPERVVGFHLAEPVATFPLVEIVPGADTSPATVARTLDLARRMGRTPIVVADRPGFLLPRLLAASFAEALRLLDEGATVGQIDAALESAGFTVGPFRRMDEIGKDRSLRLLDSLVEPLGERFRPAPLAERLRGTRDEFYLYRKGRPIRPNPALPAGLPDLGAEHGELIRDRMFMFLVNEAALALESGVAEQDAIDLASVLGVGFPRILGGVLHFAASAGPTTLLDRFDLLASRFGPRFTPAPLVHRLAPPVASGHSA